MLCIVVDIKQTANQLNFIKVLESQNYRHQCKSPATQRVTHRSSLMKDATLKHYSGKLLLRGGEGINSVHLQNRHLPTKINWKVPSSMELYQMISSAARDILYLKYKEVTDNMFTLIHNFKQVICLSHILLLQGKGPGERDWLSFAKYGWKPRNSFPSQTHYPS